MNINQKSINTLRVLSAEMIANSEIGDARSCFNATPAMFTLFRDHYNFFGGKEHINRDRFVLADIGLTPLYYSMLSLFGINFNIKDLQDFGHNEKVIPSTPNIKTLGVDASITSKGQGIPTAVGLAIANKTLASKFNAQKFNIISNFTYCFASNSNLEEGVAQEAMSLAGSLKLSKLIVLCTYNPQNSNGEDVKKKYKAMGWDVIKVKFSNSYFINNLAITKAKMQSKPTLILFYTAMQKQNKPFINDRIVTKNQVEKLKADYGTNGSYKIPNTIKQYCSHTLRKLKVEYSKWEKRVVIYKNTHPKLSEELNEYFVKQKLQFSKSLKTKLENITDLNEANKIIVENIHDVRNCLMLASIKENFLPLTSQYKHNVFTKQTPRNRSIVFGNRENAMSEICVGISLYFDAPTYVFAPICLLSEMLSGIEHSAKMNTPVLYVFYQNGSCINQQKTNIELYGQLEWLKNIKDFHIFKPATAMELLSSYKYIYDNEKTACIVFPQQDFEKIDSDFEKAKKGAYILEEQKDFEFTFVASGREVYVALELKKLLEKEHKFVKIISAPSLTIFETQPEAYKKSLLDIEKENVVILTTTNNLNINTLNLKNYTYLNISNFTQTPEIITPELIKTLFKKINKS